MNLPTIQRDAGYCLLVLTNALEGLASLLQPETNVADEQLNLVHRSELAAVFQLLGDYAGAVRAALPDTDPAQ